MTHGSLFSGIGGFDLAAEWMGWENVFSCEIDGFCNRVRKYYWPNTIQYENIKTTDFSIYRGIIDILTGGFPCQPYSMAGKRKGKADDRHLWPQMLRAIREIQPTWVVGENVRGLTNWNRGVVFDEVQADLEAAGYEVTPFLLPACAVNAPHRRDRVWFIAHTFSNGHGSVGFREDRQTAGQNKVEENQRQWIWAVTGGIGEQESTPNRKNFRLQQSRKARAWRSGFEDGSIGNVANPECFGQSGQGQHKQPINTAENRNGQTDRINGTHEIYDWKDWPTQSPLCRRNDGVPCKLDGITFPKWRNESIKAYGNAIVPQVAFQIFKAIKEYENNKQQTENTAL